MLIGRLLVNGAKYHPKEVVVDVSALTRVVRLLSVEVPLTAVPAGPAASPAADIERGTCPPPFGPLQLLQSAAQLSVSGLRRGLQRSGVLQLIQQLNEPPSPAAAEGAAPRRPGDVSTPGISGFCLADRQLHLLFAEGRADAELEQTAAAPRALPRRDARLCHHSGLYYSGSSSWCATSFQLTNTSERRQSGCRSKWCISSGFSGCGATTLNDSLSSAGVVNLPTN
ncbi:hypothetical protein FJT64_012450 [Amphibalanus amphitrite]|uniref:Uncharacterized protein n=1 Tax=Amphibalanus amphitrite TaxID=1232801 RepID=A0A6A4VII4_AMPAM|nr:hypothetical protein FJT64_012450 [Amphibalanus amphitrite]